MMKMLVYRIQLTDNWVKYEAYIPAKEIADKMGFVDSDVIRTDNGLLVAPYWAFANKEDLDLPIFSDERDKRWQEIFSLGKKLEAEAIKKAFPEDIAGLDIEDRAIIWIYWDNPPDNEIREVKINLEEIS